VSESVPGGPTGASNVQHVMAGSGKKPPQFEVTTLPWRRMPKSSLGPSVNP